MQSCESFRRLHFLSTILFYLALTKKPHSYAISSIDLSVFDSKTIACSNLTLVKYLEKTSPVFCLNNLEK